ncbi:MAG: hypothetical protein PHQ40_00340 [Anaerolineaceae bacterium]|nr:hypothetical protein [Anaerolineaceae bacterium]MDD5367504.1 hypothetical protein [Anaerolineaceae bacterium]
MTKASDNKFPKLILTEQGSTPANPDAGDQKLFIRDSDHKLCRVNSSGSVVVAEGSGDVVGPAGATDGHLAVFDGATGKVIKDGGAVPAGGGGGAAASNILINGQFICFQRQAPAVATLHADDAYGPDRWVHLCENAAGFQSHRVDGVTQRYAAQLTQNQASAQQIGLAQIVEGINCRHLRGKAVALSMKVKCSANTTIRCRVLEWTGTENAVTSDVVGTWAADISVWAANITATGASGSVATPSNTTQYDLSQTITLGSTFTNLVVLIWTDGQLVQNATLDLEAAQLEAGATPTEFEYRSVATELRLCQRYYEKSYGIDVLPGSADGTYEVLGYSYNMLTRQLFIVEKFAVPTVTVWAAEANNGAGTINRMRNDSQGGLVTPGTIHATTKGIPSVEGLSGAYFGYNYTAEAEL